VLSTLRVTFARLSAPRGPSVAKASWGLVARSSRTARSSSAWLILMPPTTAAGETNASPHADSAIRPATATASRPGRGKGSTATSIGSPPDPARGGPNRRGSGHLGGDGGAGAGGPDP